MQTVAALCTWKHKEPMSLAGMFPVDPEAKEAITGLYHSEQYFAGERNNAKNQSLLVDTFKRMFA